MQYNTTSTTGLGNITIPKMALPSIVVGNYKDVKVKKNAVVTLTGNIFGKVEIDEGAQVTFSSPVVNLKELEMEKGKAGSPTKVLFNANCNVLVKKKVKVEENCIVNPTSKNVVFYVEEENFEVKAKNTFITASIYIPTEDLKVEGYGPCFMTGRFIAKYIDGHAGHVTWNSYDCASPPPTTPIIPTQTENITKMEVLAFPNPTNDFFNLQLKTDGSDQVSIRLLAISGKVIQKLTGTPGQIFRIGDGLLPGIYIAELSQGKEKVMVKLVKQK